jgi:hypothetical protein
MTTMPVFVFQREPHIEREHGFMLAGRLYVGIPEKDANKKRNLELIRFIFSELARAAEAGRLPERPEALVIGWPNGCKPDDAADIGDDEVMAPWAARSTKIMLRFGDPVGDGKHLLIDSEVMDQLIGMPPEDTP